MTTGGLLSEYCAGLPEQRRETIEVPPKGSQKARQATVAVRFGAIELNRPERTGTGDQPRSVTLWVVDVSEIDPPRGIEPLHWRLLTRTRSRHWRTRAGSSHALDHRTGVGGDHICKVCGFNRHARFARILVAFKRKRLPSK